MKDNFNKNEEKYKIEINQLRKKVNIIFLMYINLDIYFFII